MTKTVTNIGNGDGYGGFLGIPRSGQFVTKRETESSESNLPEKQANILAKSLMLVELVGFVAFILLWIAFGRIVFLGLGWIGLGVGAKVWIDRNRKESQKEARVTGAEVAEYDVTLPLATLFVLAVLWTFTWSCILDAMSFRVFWLMFALVCILYFSIPIIHSRRILSWRMFNEISDDNFPPAKAVVDYPFPIHPDTDPDDVWDWKFGRTPPPEPHKPEWISRKAGADWFVKMPQDDNGGRHWSFHEPVDGLFYATWVACASMSKSNPVDGTYLWPGAGMDGVSMRTHKKLQNYWISQGLAKKRNDNNVVLTDEGVAVMEKVIQEPYPTSVHGNGRTEEAA